jgi:Flp pilus assembly protein TadD
LAILLAATGAYGQSSRAILDASGSPMNSQLVGRDGREEPRMTGSVSAKMLERPLEGKSVRLLERAQKFIATGETGRAMVQLREAARDQRAEPYALAMLGTEHLKRGEIDAALPLLEAAVQMMPGDPMLHSNYAMALHLRGRNLDALRQSRRAVQLDPANAQSRYVLAIILLVEGQIEEAEFQLAKAATRIPVAAEALEALHTAMAAYAASNVR